MYQSAQSQESSKSPLRNQGAFSTSIVRRLKAQLADLQDIHSAVTAQLAEIERLPQRLGARAFAGSA
jgi:hypothetical protein